MDAESIAALRCVRVVRQAPGTVREIELVQAASGYAVTSQIRKWVNSIFGFEALLQDPEGSSNEGESLDVVVTNSEHRLILDLLVSALPSDSTDDAIAEIFHISTFADSIDYQIPDDRNDDVIITFDFAPDALAGNTPLAEYARQIFESRENSGRTCRELVTNDDIVAAYESGGFDWSRRLRNACVVDVDFPALVARFGPQSIIDLDATSAVFVGKCDFAGAVFSGHTRFSGAVFDCPTVSFVGATFDLDAGDLSFRNARIFTGELLFDGAEFTANRPGRSVSFEDARITGRGRPEVDERSVKVSFNRVRAMGLAMVLFQLVAPRAEVTFIDAQVSEHVDFNDAQVRRLLFIAISSLVSLDLKLRAPKNGVQSTDLVIENCVIRSLLQIDNVATLSLRGTIIDGHLVTRWLVEDRSGRQLPNYGLLDAIAVNNDTIEERSQQFLALKQNFADLGQYDLEDEAFARFMFTKRRDRTTDAIMGAIRIISNYGISPGQVLKSVGVTVLLFALIYGLTDAFFPEWYGFADNGWPWWDSIVLSLSSFMGLGIPVALSNAAPVFLTLLEGVLGWFFLGIFSVAIVRRTLR